MPRQGLLESLQQYACYGILSNLRTPQGRSAAAHEVQNLAPQDFPLEEWEETASYLTGNECHFESVQQAHAFLCEL